MDPTATREVGRTGVALTRLGYGAAHLGELYRLVDDAEARRTVEEAFARGTRYFDTAPWYGHGLSEHRVGQALRGKPRESFVLSTKVGRVYVRPERPATFDRSPWVGGLPFQPRFDYGYDGVMHSYEDSLMRLGLNRVDLLVIHDLDFGYHATEEGVHARFVELAGGFRALEELKTNGDIQGIGAGINEAPMIGRFLERFAIDFFLVAMPYTLLDQTPLDDALPRCAERGVGIVIGSPFASGILATGPIEGAKYGYAKASFEILEKVRRIAAVCGRHGVPLQAAALQFPLGHPSVAAVIPGAVSPAEVEQNFRMMRVEIPADLWAELKHERLLHPAAPVPG
ncbi:MAG: aldo/keto reductase [Geminicoccaceae bacterium]